MVASALRRAVTIGLVAGAAALYVGLVGLVEAFQPRNIVTGYLGLGTVMLGIIAFVAGYRAGAPMRVGRGAVAPLGAGPILAASLLAGAIAGAMLGALVVVMDAVNLQVMLVSASAGLKDALMFTDDAISSALVLVGLSAAIAVVAAALHLLPERIRRPITWSLVTVLLISMLEPIVRVMLVQLDAQWSFLPFGELANFLYLRGGLTLTATIVLLVLVPIVIVGWANRDRLRQRRERREPRDDELIEDIADTTTRPRERRRLTTSQMIWWGLFGLFLVTAPFILGVRLSEVIGTVGLFVLLGLGLNIVVGYAGLLDLGYVAFFAVGSYVTAVLTSPASPAFAPELSFWAALPFVMVAAALIGLMVGFPVLRLRGDYLAIVTLGLGEIARILFLSDWLAPWVGGAQGILRIPPPEPIGRDPQQLYYPIVLFCILAAIAAWSLANSRVGRAWNAMREDEEVAEATGINTTKYKLLAFATGAAFGCIGGAFFAVKIGSVFPHSFDIEVSINALAIVILGGIGSIPGVILGAAVLVGLPELLREFAEYRLLIYGALLVAMMILRPEGLIPNRQRQAELRESEDDDDQYASDAGAETGEPVITTGAAG
ncbi:MAG TPA: hypothetical protein VHR55_07840 [Candidatus Limnocylindria bacterium]|nr:hypothetical protein [Candidatus Limnocylindria bacterium]